ncbi:MAG: AbrB/MazE/SpoVT family DNA-binding domain-containing protein [Clostridia bacterium]|nr:AbrB/MazE/SpoVT family DNA-binding domain-containing protein [Clostridia bacterium]
MEEHKKFIWTTKINEKGQIVIPKEARDVFGYKSGDVLLLFGDTEKGIAIGRAEDYVKFAETVLNKINGGEND